jgi:hypothetical protein
MTNKNESKKAILGLKEEYKERVTRIQTILNMDERDFNSKIYGMGKEPKTEREIFIAKQRIYKNILEELEGLLQ